MMKAVETSVATIGFDRVDNMRGELHILPVNLLKPFEIDGNMNFSEEDYNRLKGDIRERGIKSPLHVYPQETGVYLVLSGNRRLRIAIEIGITELLCFIINEGLNHHELTEYALLDNLARGQLTHVQKVVYALILSELEKVKAKLRQAKAGMQNLLVYQSMDDVSLVRSDSDLTKESNEKGKALTIAAKKAGIPYETVFYARKVKESNPTLWNQVIDGQVSLSEALATVKPQNDYAGIAIYKQVEKKIVSVRKISEDFLQVVRELKKDTIPQTSKDKLRDNLKNFQFMLDDMQRRVDSLINEWS
ncbi:MAG: ParB N-terminal domain-containing protein [Candidatus Magnetobacterium sp. LHC-1]